MTRAAARLTPALLATLLPAACAAPATPTLVRSPAPLPGLVEDVRSLARPSNAERHEALLAILDARGLPHETAMTFMVDAVTALVLRLDASLP